MSKTRAMIAIPSTWATQLKKKARKLSVKHDKDIKYTDLIRETLKKVYNLKD